MSQFVCQVMFGEKHSVKNMYSICIFLFLIFTKICLSTSQNIDSLENDDEEAESIIFRQRRAVNFYQTGHKLQGEMSKTLDQLLGPNYNKRIRPNYGGPPVLVELNLSIRSIVRSTNNIANFLLQVNYQIH